MTVTHRVPEPSPVNIDEPVMLIRIAKMYRPGMSDVALYERLFLRREATFVT